MKQLFFALLLLAGTAFAQEDKLIAVLKSDAPLKDKADACQELARIGTARAVPALAPLLADEQLAHRARVALEPIPDPSVDAALRDALRTLQGRLLIGVMISLGVRKDTQAVEPLARFLTASDPAVAQAAARALGSLGPQAAPELLGALAHGLPTNQLAVCEGLLRCAEAMPPPNAAEIYDQLRAVPNLPHQVRVAALRGAIRSRGLKGVPLMLEAIRTESYVPAADAIRVSTELPGAEVTLALVGEVAGANEEKQQLLLQALGYRGDPAAAPALVSLAQSGSTNRRTAAIRSLVQLATPSSVAVLSALVKDREPAVSGAALTGLTGFRGPAADAAIVGLLQESDPKVRVAAMDAVSQRRMASAVPALLKAAADPDTGVAGAGFKVLGELAGPAEIPSVVDAMARTRAVPAAESALAAICARQTDMAACADQLLPGLAQTRGEAKLALLRVLPTVGDPKALAAVRAAAADANASVKETALRAVCDWPTPAALPDLEQIAKTTPDATFKYLALRGQLRLIPLQSVSEAQKLSQLRQILPLLERKEEQRLALAALGELPSVESLALIRPFLAGEGLKEEASVAAVSVAEKIVASHPAEVAEAMKQIQTKDPQLAGRVRQVLARVK